jgi:hypothetical protein
MHEVTRDGWEGRDEEENKVETKMTKKSEPWGSPSLGGAQHAQQWQGGQRIHKGVPGDHENTRGVLWRRVGRVIESTLKRGKKALTLPPERP